MNNKRFFLFFFLILFVGALLRFYQLGNIPGSLDWDEVSFGYNAYSVLKTGKDEYGAHLPLVFRAFGEYKQPVYMYLDTASLALFGVNAFAVRFPSALFGTIAIIFVYLLTYELFRKYPFAKNMALLAMLSFAISPWSIQFSRGAFEANVSLCFVIAAVWLFILGLRQKNNWYMFFSTILLIVSTYTYISQKIFVPLLFVSLVLYGLSYFKKQKVFAVGLLILFAVGSSLWLLNTKSVSRGQGVLFTNQKAELLAPSIKELQYDKEHHDVTGVILHNRRIVYAQNLITNYLSHFNPIWLFITGDTILRHHAPGMGILYLMSLPFILAGVYFLFAKAFQITWILFAWFLFAPLASSLTFEAPHALRSLIFLPTWQIFEAAGIIFLFQKLKKGTVMNLISAFVAVLFFINVFYFLHQYFVHTNTDVQKDWQYGYKEAITFINSHNEQGKRIVFSKSFEQPHIFYLFYTKYDPAKYIASGGSWRTSKKCYTIDTAYFGDCSGVLRSGDYYVALGDETVPNAKVLKRFDYTTGEPATTVYQHE